jgi:hypothetical protein
VRYDAERSVAVLEDPSAFFAASGMAGSHGAIEDYL